LRIDLLSFELPISAINAPVDISAFDQNNQLSINYWPISSLRI